MIPYELVQKINRGRCFVLVGSGPSSEMGYPTWKDLANLTYAWLIREGVVKDKLSYQAYLDKQQYPEFFQQAEADLGSRQKLIDALKSFLHSSGGRGYIYEIITKWPFACYLTTNYDDELSMHLKASHAYFSVLQNRLEDFSYLRDGAGNVVQKLHSDLNHPEEVVITSADYQKLYPGYAGAYFRDKLRQAFEMFDFLIVGHSLVDPDISDILQVARETSSAIHPIYMIAPNCTTADEREYKRKYNIVLLRYKNAEGSHNELRRMLSSTNRFISHRGKMLAQFLSAGQSIEEIKAAASLFLFRITQPTWSKDNIVPLILVALSDVGNPGISVDDLLKKPSLTKIFQKGEGVRDEIQRGLDVLVGRNLVGASLGQYWITQQGLKSLGETEGLRKVERDQAYGQFLIDLKKECPNLTVDQERDCQQVAEKVIVNVFASRGLSVANKVFVGQSAGAEELTDIFKCVSQAACTFDGIELRAAFLEAMHSFVVNPNDPQKKYLASISQGYFLFHLLGMDPTCTKLRREIFSKTLWVCDSSILLPLISVGCHNFKYATTLFDMLTRANAVLCTTPKFLQEVWEHFKWAVDFVARSGVDSIEFLEAALAKDSYKQNLFLDGYIRLSAEGKVRNFLDYIHLICPVEVTLQSFETNIAKHGVKILDFSSLKGFQKEAWFGEVEEIKAKIKEERESRGTLRSDLQTESEAEVCLLVQKTRSGELSCAQASFEKCYFVSQSRVLDRIIPGPLITWTPEAMYRYLSSLPEERLDPELLQQCMLNEYFYAGVSFIDKERYIRFFGPSIDASKVLYEEEKNKYISQVEAIPLQSLDEAFAGVSDLDKPYFVARMGWRLAEVARRSEECATKRAIVAEEKVKQLLEEKDVAWKKRQKDARRQDAARLRHLRDPQYLRKKQRQAKKRHKK